MQAEAAHQLPDLKKLLKLYTSISIEKLATLLNTDVATLTVVLRSMQIRKTQKCWVAGDAFSGQETAVTDVDFKIVKDKASGEDMVMVNEHQFKANHLATLAKHILRFEQITRDMEVHVQALGTAAAR
jgi:translation initiation factor 3 subunit L